MMNKPSVQRDNSGALTIKITSDAVNHIRSFGQLEGKDKTNLRVAVKGGGCSGLTYVLELAENPLIMKKLLVRMGWNFMLIKNHIFFLLELPWSIKAD